MYCILHGWAFAPKCGDLNTRMDTMAESTIWWLLAGTAVGIELVTGTFYLLMLSVGLAAAAIAAHLGASSAMQLVIAAVVGAGTVTGWRSYRKTQPVSEPASTNKDVNLDIGEMVQVDHWNPDGTSTVKYRGTNWSVSSEPGTALELGIYRVVEVIGSRLVVRKPEVHANASVAVPPTSKEI